jgi:glucosamine--fructose-6-phosphate aminotransferase (isomerizing)
MKRGVVAPDLVKGLKFLEYRGYDSAGVATIDNSNICVEKDKGKVDDIESRLGLSRLPGSIGIAHTRWATHGAPDKVNAHPHTDCDNRIAVVHNGIIDNFNDLKQRLIKKGHVFRSLTDTEVVPHLIEDYIKEGMSFREAVISALKELDGSFALAIISLYEPDLMVCVKKESPLIIGLGSGVMYCASDISSLAPFTDRFIVLDDNEVAFLTCDSYHVYRLPDMTERVKEPVTISIKVEDALKGEYPHYMLKEIFEQPISLSYSIRLQEHYLSLMADLLDRSKDIYMVAAGTSYHAALVGSYILSKIARMVTTPVIASEFISRYGDSIGVDTTVLAISQSGETIDVLKAVEYAKSRAATILGITNVLASSLTRVSRVYIHQQSGPEIGVAATKTFTGQLAVLYQLALIAGKRRGKLSQKEMDELKLDIKKIPDIVKHTLDKTNDITRELAKKYSSSRYVIFLGRGVSYPVALEGRLKLLEISYIPSLAYPAGESKHGPISLVEKGVPIIFVAPPDDTRKLIIGNIEEMKARGGTIVIVGDENDEELRSMADDYIGVPSINPLFSPIPYVVPLQLFAYYTAVLLGHDPDRPRNLAKSVTVL